VLAQASADIAKRLAASTALPVFRKDLLPLITGVVVVVNLAMRHRVFRRICVERRYLRHRDSLSLRIYESSYSGSGFRSNRLLALLGDGLDHRFGPLSARARRSSGGSPCLPEPTHTGNPDLGAIEVRASSRPSTRVEISWRN
jgi:hypothetical protein